MHSARGEVYSSVSLYCYPEFQLCLTYNELLLLMRLQFHDSRDLMPLL